MPLGNTRALSQRNSTIVTGIATERSRLSHVPPPPTSSYVEHPRAMSANPAYVMGTLCIVGGITGYARTRSIPSIVAGVSVGLLYLYSAESIRKGTPSGLNTALLASAILFLSSAPRAAKGPVPASLTVASALAGTYYGKTVFNL